MIWRRLYHMLWTQGYGGDSVSLNPANMAVIHVKRKHRKRARIGTGGDNR